MSLGECVLSVTELLAASDISEACQSILAMSMIMITSLSDIFAVTWPVLSNPQLPPTCTCLTAVD
jgi:hypothetical protein